jgi:hypothetical protein
MKLGFEYIFKAAEKDYSNKKNHNVYKISLYNLIDKNGYIKNWEYNRAPDELRITEIYTDIMKAEFIHNNNLFCVYNKADSTLYIYDGIHRYTALYKIFENSKSDFDKLKNQTIILNVYETNDIDADSEYIKHLFICLNKSEPVHELYIGNNDSKKIKIVENAANHFINKYPKLKKDTDRPHRPFFSRKILLDLFNHLYYKYKITKTGQLEYIMNSFNMKLEKEINETGNLRNTTFSLTQFNKCNEHKLFIFLYNFPYLTNNIPKIIKFDAQV